MHWRPRSGSAVLLLTAAGLLGLVLVASALVGATAGPVPAGSVVVGGLAGLAVMGFGASTMHVVAGVMPHASLPLGLLTYLFQVVVTVTFLLALTRSGVLADQLDRQWVGLALIVTVVAWSATHAIVLRRARIPLYELGRRGVPAEDGGSR